MGYNLILVYLVYHESSCSQILTDSRETSSAPGKEGQDQQEVARQDGSFTNWYACFMCLIVTNSTMMNNSKDLLQCFVATRHR